MLQDQHEKVYKVKHAQKMNFLGLTWNWQRQRKTETSHTKVCGTSICGPRYNLSAPDSTFLDWSKTNHDKPLAKLDMGGKLNIHTDSSYCSSSVWEQHIQLALLFIQNSSNYTAQPHSCKKISIYIRHVLKSYVFAWILSMSYSNLLSGVAMFWLS